MIKYLFVVFRLCLIISSSPRTFLLWAKIDNKNENAIIRLFLATSSVINSLLVSIEGFCEFSWEKLRSFCCVCFSLKQILLILVFSCCEIGRINGINKSSRRIAKTRGKKIKSLTMCFRARMRINRLCQIFALDCCWSCFPIRGSICSLRFSEVSFL